MDLAHAAAPGRDEAAGVDDEAVAALARTDRGAFAELYVRHRDAVYGYLRARTDVDDDALELTAVTFERALVAIDGYRPRGAGFRAWLFRIARNAAADEGRRRRRARGRGLAIAASSQARGGTPIDPAPGPAEATLASDERRRVLLAVAALPDAQREAIGLRFGAGLTAREIGLVIGRRDAAVQKLIERAIERLREVLA